MDADPRSKLPAMSRRLARRLERLCCYGITYFPLVFVYGLTTWAVYVVSHIGFAPTKSGWIGACPVSAHAFAGDARAMRVGSGALDANGDANLHRPMDLRRRHRALPYAQLELHHRRLHAARQHHKR